MATFSCKTRGNSSPERKPRVFFTCHPDDFEKCFDKICEDVFKTHDCAIFYTEDLNEEIGEKYKESDLGQMNLFVIPVTFKLLSKPNRAMDSDFRYAKEKQIPVLPIMMEPGLDELYSQKDKFGELQYLNPFAHDLTAISYEEKLKKYLESVLISDEMAERIRKAFDAYIFMSYRKKDRHYANELMKMIHSHPEFRDIAIWYDEFLTPGESFRENIERMMKDSKLFALLVTPNLLEYVNGEPNYVMKNEYPDAKKAGMDILPIEMEETDKGELRSKFDDIPDCVHLTEDEVFRNRLADTLSKIALSRNNDDPEHTFLIGLAYLEGIDVEVNIKRGIALITTAANAGLLAAMDRLYDMYNEGIYVDLNYHEAAQWGEKLTDYAIEFFGEEDLRTLTSLNNLAITYGNLGNFQKALELKEKGYSLISKTLDKKSPEALIFLNSLAVSYKNMCDSQKALELLEKVYHLQCEGLGEEHLDTIDSLSKLGIIYFESVSRQKGIDMLGKAYTLYCKILGEEHPNTLMSLNNLAVAYSDLRDSKKALELQKKAYALMEKHKGKEHPYTLCIMHDLAYTYGNLEEFQKEYELNEEIYALRCKVLGKEHPQTLCTLKNMAILHYRFRNYKKAAELLTEVYIGQCKVLGKDHHDTMETKEDLCYTLVMLRNQRN